MGRRQASCPLYGWNVLCKKAESHLIMKRLSPGETMVDLLPFLTSVIGLRDPHGKGHSNHVMELSRAFGHRVDLTSVRIETLTFAAEIHDIGKIAINEFIINKPGRFTEAEYLMVQHHAQLGANLIATLHLDPLIPLIILHHHENYDGSGYPHKLKGDQIPLESRIIRITDTYDALTSNRGYRAAYSSRKALAIMEQEHSFFDPQLLEIFFKLQGGKKH
jgi:HD-GYP domain-containing protein (c-di-GMP phosphodiesterase class II)